MSRLQVGEILIDGSNVSIGGRSVVAARATRPGPEARADPDPAHTRDADPLRLLVRLPLPARALAVAGGVAMALGTAANLLLAAWSNPVDALLRGGFLLPAGFALLAIAAAKHFATRPAVLHGSVLGNDPERYLARLATLLVSRHPRQTIEWIAEKTGWTEEVVVHALALLRARGEVDEDLDLDTGEFFYVHVPPPSPGPRDLDTRLGDLNP